MVSIEKKKKGLYRKLFWGRGDGSVSQVLASQTQELEFNSQDPRQSSGKGGPRLPSWPWRDGDKRIPGSAGGSVNPIATAGHRVSEADAQACSLTSTYMWSCMHMEQHICGHVPAHIRICVCKNTFLKSMVLEF